MKCYYQLLLSSWQWLKTKVATTLSSLEPLLSPAMVDLRELIILKMTKDHDESQVGSNDGNNAMREINISLMVFKIELVM